MGPESSNHCKLNVYSFGIVLLEIVKCVRLSNVVLVDGIEEEAEFTRTVNSRYKPVLQNIESSLIKKFEARWLCGSSVNEYNHYLLTALHSLIIGCPKS
ncbi:hypothetical protein GIB67_007760 [Kingdonia uniflora]|uniref:Uncharacterized protein n=1 Tax=Kingdonia uniflora TaxID=39325 RepID=A0A7J7N1P9_9MAGN|nr:hypothetical protein GIB67_007760 [Kingdonia uniflora]